MIDQATRELIPLTARTPFLAGCRVMQVSGSGYKPTSMKYAQVPRSVQVTQKKKLTFQCDELWSFSGQQREQQWVWLADADTREIVEEFTAHATKQQHVRLWVPLTSGLSSMCHCLHRFWAAYAAVFQTKRHRAVGKETGKTSHVERFNNTQQVSRLVGKPYPFLSLWRITSVLSGISFHHYNASLLV